jgi:RNA polymerase sigma-70 factor (ECF subfamily)
MSGPHLDQLLAQLNSGDVAAAEQVFRTYEPSLRILVRRELRSALRAKFDSMDVVQAVWADILEGVHQRGWHFTDGDHLQAFLVRLAKNRFIDLCRKYREAVRREEPLTNEGAVAAIVSDSPRPSEVAQRNELWDRIMALCPPSHHELVRLKLKGLTLAQIAAETGMHPNSVRRILFELAHRLATADDRSGSLRVD